MRGLLAAAVLCPLVAAGAEPFFADRAADTGLLFAHDSGKTGRLYMPEIMGSGVALLDYDNDGDLDVYLLQGAVLDPDGRRRPLRNRLFRNRLAEAEELVFEDVTAEAGVGHAGFAMGAATGDYDADGDIDLFVSNYGPDVLYRNNGDGTFSDATRAARVGDPSFGASAAFFDADGDGDLDLFLTRYNAFSVGANKDCYGPAGERDYCGPLEYAPLPDKLYLNDGKGGFDDATGAAGVTAAFGNGLGVVAADFNRDGRDDVFVANDKTLNQLWINQGGGKFRDEALFAGTALNADGMAEAGMGATAADFDSDGDLDLFLTHIDGETNTLYVNEGDGLFEDATNRFGLGHTSIASTGFGVLWFDADNDGDLDLYAANGRVRSPYPQPNQFFLNDGGVYRDASREAGEGERAALVSRGAAFGDLDNDGDIDIVVNNADGPAQLLLNGLGSRGDWLIVAAAEGSAVELELEDGTVLSRRASSGGGYLSAHDGRVHFGLGKRKAAAVVVRPPHGETKRRRIERVNRIVDVRAP